jgi:hypothetical protein
MFVAVLEHLQIHLEITLLLATPVIFAKHQLIKD